jgi:hypothetical protein
MNKKVLAGTIAVLLGAAAVAAQDQPKTDVPYECSSLTITFSRCGNVGGQDMCFYQARNPAGAFALSMKPDGVWHRERGRTSDRRLQRR